MKNKFLQVVNWKQFQHYSKRNPPWIKMYQSLLDTYEFTELSDEAKAHLIQIWLLAAKTGNRIPYDAKWVAKRINAKGRVNLQALIDAGWLQVADAMQTECTQDASPMLASCKQNPLSETETEPHTPKGDCVGGASLKKPGCSEKPDVAPAGVTPAPVLPPKAPSLPPMPTKVKPATKTDERFEQFWKAYPRKVGKGQARKIWGKLRPNAELLERILSAIEAQSKSEQWTQSGGQFIPHPGTWLNQERWDDEDVAGSSGGMTRHEELDRAFGPIRTPTDEELAIALGVDLEEVQDGA